MEVWVEGEYTAPDANATEFEVQDFLWGLARVLKPKVTLETGCYQGHGTFQLARAYRDGRVFSCDTNPAMVATAMEYCKYQKNVVITNCTGLELCSRIRNVDLAFIDSGGDRVEEARALHMNPGGIVVLHDATYPDWQPIRKMWKEIYFSTPRGMSLFQV